MPTVPVLVLLFLAAGVHPVIVEPTPAAVIRSGSACSSQVLLLRAQVSSQRAVIDRLRSRLGSRERLVKGGGGPERDESAWAGAPSSLTTRTDTKLWRGLVRRVSMLQIEGSGSKTVPVALPEVREAAFELRTALLNLRPNKRTLKALKTMAEGSNPCAWKLIECNQNGTSVVTVKLYSMRFEDDLPGDLFSNPVWARLSKLLLSALRMSSLPESIGNLKWLRHLYLHDNQLSSLPESIGNLPRLQELILRNNQLSSLPESFGNLTSLSDLRLRRNRLSSLPESFGNLASLSKLWLEHNQLSSLPESISNLKRLRNLHLEGNQLPSLPESFGNLTSLSTLRLRNNRLSSLPESFGNLTRLRNLYLQDNQLSSLPESFGNLPSLSELTLKNNRLSSLPESFGNLPSLSELTLKSNRLSSLPESFGNLKRLRNLHLEGNRLLSLPESFGNLTSLWNLYLQDNQLLSLPESFGNMPRLEELILRNNRLSSLPKSFGNLTSLPELILTGNQLSSLPESFGNLKRLVRLELNGNPLSSLPESFGNLPSLSELILRKNRLSSLPESFGNLKRLRNLHLQDNQLLSLPESFGNMPRLEELILRNNRLSSLPKSFGNMPRLLSLYLQHNRLSSLPESFSNMTILYELYLQHNRLSSLPESFGNLKWLNRLKLNGNQLSSLPESFGNLKLLTRLELNGNQLSSLPESFGNMTRLFSVYLQNNQLSSLPESFGNLKWLNNLQLQQNRLSSLPESLGILGNLESLHLEHNMIERLPHMWRSREMRRLLLHHNRLSTLPDWVVKIHLSVQMGLDLSYNHISDIPIMMNEKLQKLSLAYNRLVELPERAFQGLRKVDNIDLSNNYLSHLPESLFLNCTKLEAVDLSHNRLIAIPGSLTTRPKLKVVAVNNNHIERLTASVWRWVMEAERVQVSIQSNPLLLNRASTPLVMKRKNRGSLYVDRNLFPDSISVSEAAVRILGVGQSDRLVEWRQTSDIATSGHGESCSIMMAFHPESDVGFFVRECRCVQSFYWSVVLTECKACPRNAMCNDGSVECFEGFYLWHGVDATVACVACPAGVHCEKNEVHPQSGQWWDLAYVGPAQDGSASNATGTGSLWAYQQEGTGPAPGSSFVYTCRNEDACHGGDEGACSEGYEGKLCSICSDGYYSSAHGICEQCPALGMTVAYSAAGMVTASVTLAAVFMRASVQAGKAAEEMRKINISPMQVAGEILTSFKILLSFLQVVVALDVVFDVEWPRMLHIADDVFGWVNLDWLKSSSLECLWEHGGMASDGSSVTALLSFTYYTRLCISSGLPLLMSGGLLVLFGVTQALLKIKRLNLGGQAAALMRGIGLRCLQSHLLLWTFVYLPISSRSFGFFLCDTFDGGRTHWIHDDLSIECYTDTYYEFMPVAIVSLAVYTLGFPLFVVGAFAVKRISGRHAARGVSSSHWLRAMWGEAMGTLSRPYKDHLGYWDAVEMGRKVLVGAAAMHFGSTPTFQLTVALMISFVAAVVHFYYQPFKAASSNRLAGMNLVLVYFTMSLGLLRRLDVSESKRMVFGGAVMAMDGAFCAVLFSIILWDIVESVRKHGYSALTRAARRVGMLCGAVKR